MRIVRIALTVQRRCLISRFECYVQKLQFRVRNDVLIACVAVPSSGLMIETDGRVGVAARTRRHVSRHRTPAERVGAHPSTPLSVIGPSPVSYQRLGDVIQPLWFERVLTPD